MESICEEFEKVVKKQAQSSSQAFENVDKLLNTLLEHKQQQQQEQDITITKTNLKATHKQVTTLLSDTQKDLYNSVGKFQKYIDKQKYWKTDLDSLWDPKAFNDSDPSLVNALATHFVREGRFNTWDSLNTESKKDTLILDQNLKQQFIEMFNIVESIKVYNNLDLAIQWATTHQPDITNQQPQYVESSSVNSSSSSLLFELYRGKFIQFLRSGDSSSALEYASKVFSRFQGGGGGNNNSVYAKEIQRLMCSILYIGRLDKSPYTDLLDPNLYSNLCNQFTRDFAILCGLAPDSPLFISVTAGTLSLPTIVKMSFIMSQGRHKLEWSSQGEFPVEIPLLDSQRFHSVFACPVSKEQATEENPPMIMNCGHVLNKESLNRLSKGSSSNRFKCPYCPQESTSAQAIRVHF